MHTFTLPAGSADWICIDVSPQKHVSVSNRCGKCPSRARTSLHDYIYCERNCEFIHQYQLNAVAMMNAPEENQTCLINGFTIMCHCNTDCEEDECCNSYTVFNKSCLDVPQLVVYVLE